ncbi:hypothetical protein CCACVL1_04258 [Corchorus capsularis]|uniref:Uncharacterized protein n=1 Tax=Corchorus capsularis TaxID=210143 RepID=A0A1R3JTS5_COCAP|nr:hypothetical protein CCACVL1_04258 [Corchorus capsularis]
MGLGRTRAELRALHFNLEPSSSLALFGSA